LLNHKPIGLDFRYTHLCAGLSDLNLILLATISYNELFTQTHMSLCRREPCTARVSALYFGKWV